MDRQTDRQTRRQTHRQIYSSQYFTSDPAGKVIRMCRKVGKLLILFTVLGDHVLAELLILQYFWSITPFLQYSIDVTYFFSRQSFTAQLSSLI